MSDLDDFLATTLARQVEAEEALHNGDPGPRLGMWSTQEGALPPSGALVGASLYVDPEVLEHDTVVFAAGTQTESVKMQTQELFGTGEITTVPLVKRPERGSDHPVT
jgi:hypothetical protein